MEQTAKEKIRLGLFVIMGSMLIVVAAYLIGQRQNMFGQTFELTAVFQNVNGLQLGNNVRFSGINVGTVKDIEMVDDTTIRVHLIIQEEIQAHLRKNAIATIGSDGLVGNMLINISPSKGNVPRVESGDELDTYSRIATEDLMGTLSVSNENIALLTKDLLDITESLNSGQGTLGLLLKDSTVAKQFSNTILHLEGTSRSANRMMTELHGIVNGIHDENNVAHVLLEDTVSGNRLADMIENLESASADIDELGSEMGAMIEKMNQGDGALNYLSTDSAFKAKLDRTMSQVEKGSLLLNEDLEALQHNFLFRKYFRKMEKLERKNE